jgi:hypothetical protein
MVSGVEARDGHRLPLEVADGSNAASPEQFEATDVVPAKSTIGRPASSWTRNGATNAMLMSTSPETKAGYGLVSGMFTYCTSVNPSIRSSSCATYWGATQMPAIWESRSRVVSGAGSAAAGRTRRTPAVPTAVKVATNSRRLHDWARLSAMVSPLARLREGHDVSVAP